MKVYAGSDHAGLELRRKLVVHLAERGHQVIDVGPATAASCDYPDYAATVGRAVRDDQSAVGLLVCGTGIGVSIAANKIPGIRAADPWSPEAARLSRAHNDANVLCLGARLIPEAEAFEILDTWLATPFEGGRHVQRIAKITALEDEARTEKQKEP